MILSSLCCNIKKIEKEILKIELKKYLKNNKIENKFRKLFFKDVVNKNWKNLENKLGKIDRIWEYD